MEIRSYESSDRHAVIDLWTSVFEDNSDHNSPELSLNRKLEFGDELLFVAANSSDLEIAGGGVRNVIG